MHSLACMQAWGALLNEAQKKVTRKKRDDSMTAMQALSQQGAYALSREHFWIMIMWYSGAHKLNCSNFDEIITLEWQWTPCVQCNKIMQKLIMPGASVP